MSLMDLYDYPAIEFLRFLWLLQHEDVSSCTNCERAAMEKSGRPFVAKMPRLYSQMGDRANEIRFTLKIYNVHSFFSISGVTGFDN